MHRPFLFLGTAWLCCVLIQHVFADTPTQPKPFDYTAVLKQVRATEKQIAADPRNDMSIVEILQGEAYPKALREAAQCGDDAGLLELYQVKHKTAWPRTVKGTSLLSYACMNGDADVVKLLIARGAEVKAANEEGWTPLHHAAEAGSVEICKMLLDKKANVNARTTRFLETPLMFACGLFGGGRFTSEACARLLLARGAHINAQNKDGETSLMFAANMGRLDVVRLLLAEGADATHTDNKNKSALSRIVEFTTLDKDGKVTVTQDSTTIPVYKTDLMGALISHGKAAPGLYMPGIEAKVQKDGLNDFLTIIRLLRAAGATP